MILNVISTKYRLDLVTRNLTRDEMVDFFAQIVIRPTMEVKFLNPFTNTWKTINAYRGDRAAQPAYPMQMKEGNNDVLIELFNPINNGVIFSMILAFSSIPQSIV